MADDETLAQREAQAGPFPLAFRRHKRLEEPLPNLGRDPGPRVGDRGRENFRSWAVMPAAIFPCALIFLSRAWTSGSELRRPMLDARREMFVRGVLISWATNDARRPIEAARSLSRSLRCISLCSVTFRAMITTRGSSPRRWTACADS